MTNLKDKVCMIYDYGLFEEVAVVLARKFKRVLYYVPYRGAFPKSSVALIGKGFEGVERVPLEDGKKDFWDYYDMVDLFVFPDIMDGDLQKQLRKLGKRVWGSGRADMLETNRHLFRDIQKRLNMPIPPTKFVKGIQALKKELEKRDNIYVKVSMWRGDFETFHHLTWKTTAEKVEEWEYKLGPKKDHLEFMLEDPIAPDGIEVGYDGYSIDGTFPDVTAFGYEIKGRAYVGKIVPYEKLAKVFKYTNNKLAGTFRDYGLRGSYSNELRIDKDETPYLIDPCMRCASPPTEVLIEAYENLAETYWAGAGGELVPQKPIAEYMALARIISTEATTNWTTIDFPDSIRKFVKLRNATYLDGKYQVMPTPMDTIGSVIGLGSTVDEAVKMVKKHAAKICGNGVEIFTDRLEDAVEAAKKGTKFGIEF